VVTRVTLALHPRPAEVASALVAIGSTANAIAFLRALERALPAGLLVFEAMWSEFYAIATGPMGLAAPLPADHDVYILVEAPVRDGTAGFEAALAEMLGRGLAVDAVVAQTEAQRRSFWALRESVYEHGRLFGGGIGFDISIPLDRRGQAIADLRAEMPARFPDARWVVFGHLADSNVHVNVTPPGGPDPVRKAVEQVVYAITRRHEGSVSAEHGIGRSKRAYLALSRTPAELELMATIKRALDPRDILNRGRVLPASG
jgi:FAD/FMN-containing dehydrogenase